MDVLGGCVPGEFGPFDHWHGRQANKAFAEDSPSAARAGSEVIGVVVFVGEWVECCHDKCRDAGEERRKEGRGTSAPAGMSFWVGWNQLRCAVGVDGGVGTRSR